MKAIPNDISFPKLEEEILALWDKEETFQKSLEIRKDAKPYIFYDGPPFATGLPHYGHILTSYIKDSIPRFFTMQGNYVDRRWGWDCHGLPVEYEVEKMLNFKGGKKEIEKYGIGKFNDKCKEVVLRYTDDWEKIIHRIGRWVDFKRQYKTMDLSYMESIMWVFAELYRKGLIYEKLRVVTYCNRCETALSNFEAGLDDSYREREDPAVTVRFKSVDDESVSFLAWTTTPWTLPSNLALGVNSEIDYGLYALASGEKVWMAVACTPKYKKLLDGAACVRTAKGQELLGTAYTPPFDVADDRAQAFRVLHGDFVDTSAGTGIVHLAPTFGEDDNSICVAAGITPFDPVGPDGVFSSKVPEFAGQDVFQANPNIIKSLKERGLLFHREQYHHSYPHCWRCDNPLIYRTINSWYVAVSTFRDKMVENNKQIAWVPQHIRDGRFGKWLEGARDWSISRNRFFGTPIPVWKCDQCDEMFVASSLEDITQRYGKPVEDLHKPLCDDIDWACAKPGCQGRMKRVPEVLDCWFESGGMPYAQVHYPFENEQHFKDNFPASFIVEYISQTRGWFYTLIVESSVLMDKPPFQNAICHGVILAEDGRKLSKRLRNFPDPVDVVNTYGSDALRICLLSSPVVKGQDIRFSENGVHEAMRCYILPLWNVAHFFTSYATMLQGYEPTLLTTATVEEDRHILSELEMFRNSIKACVLKYDLPAVYRTILSFIDTLSGWYVRNNRQRFWSTSVNDDVVQALNTLYTVLNDFLLIVAPFMPFTSDYIYRNLHDNASVHLQNFPPERPERMDEELLRDISLVRSVIETVRKIREKNRIKLRQPLARVTLSNVEGKTLEKYRRAIEIQGNIKEIRTVAVAGELAMASYRLVRKTAGPVLKTQFAEVQKALDENRFEMQPDNKIVVEGVSLAPGMYTIEWTSREEQVDTLPVSGYPGVLAALQLKITEELRLEGLAREINRHLQDLRKAKQLEYDERVKLMVVATGDWQRAFEAHKEWICDQLLVDGHEVASQAQADLNIEDELGSFTAFLEKSAR